MKTQYMVWKIEDLMSVCTKHDFQYLDTLVDRIIRKREEEGKPPANQYLVIDKDEPYAEEVKEVLKKHGYYNQG